MGVTCNACHPCHVAVRRDDREHHRRNKTDSHPQEPLRVEFLLKTDSEYPKDTGVTLFTLATSGNPLRYNTHRPAPPDSALAHSRGPRKRSQSPVDMLEYRDTYGQTQVCSKGHQGSSVDRPCQPSFCWIKFWHVWNPLPQSIRLRLSVLVRYWAGQGE